MRALEFDIKLDVSGYATTYLVESGKSVDIVYSSALMGTALIAEIDRQSQEKIVIKFKLRITDRKALLLFPLLGSFDHSHSLLLSNRVIDDRRVLMDHLTEYKLRKFLK